ncbi:MAG: hypothetical protein E7480_05595 [Ruminococcaceae bacterium]|nr:hypothetical protein [Oscillospiraceae bacterium]
MGKGKRTRLSNSLESTNKKQAKIKTSIDKKKRKKINTVIFLCIAAIAVVSAVTGIFINKLNDDGYFLRKTVSAQSDDFEVNNAMMSYFLHTEFSSFVNNYSDSLDSYGLDISKPLKSQKIPDSENTWFEYFSQNASSTVKQYLILAQNAKRNNISIEEDEIKSINSSIDFLKNSAQKENVDFEKYISQIYGHGVKEQDIRKALELRALAIKYYNIVKNDFSYSDDEIQKYFDENPASFLMCDFKKFEFSPTIPSKATEEEKKSIYAQTKKYAEELAACKTSEEFDAYLTTYLKNLYKDDSKKNNSAIEKEVNETLNKGYKYSVSDDLGKWAFENGRKINDTKVIEKSGIYAVYIMVKPSYYETYNTKNLRHIMLTSDIYGSDEKAKEKAEEILKKWNDSEKTDTVFSAFVKEFSEDTNTRTKDGKLENTLKDELTGNFDLWAFSSSRKVGDCDIVKSDFGYHIAYFDGDGIEAWKQIAINELKSKDYSKKYETFEKTTKIIIDSKKISKIPDIN